MANNMIGQKFCRLTVVGEERTTKHGAKMWKCLCECGNTTVVRTDSLMSGQTKSCGCFSRDRVRKANTTHGGRQSRLYSIWHSMKTRCQTQSSGSFANYGSRGITVCEEWMSSFEKFKEWALANGYRDDLTIERHDVDGDYCPENCSWATKKEQGNNRRNNVLITYKGETKTLQQWADELPITYNALYKRLQRGWSVEKAFTTVEGGK